jgi:hypothetical protein
MSKAILTVMLGAMLVCAAEPEALPKPKLKVEVEADLSGYWECKGIDGDSKEYSGVVSIRKLSNVYVVSWLIGLTNFVGVGVKDGDTFNVGWALQGKGGDVQRGVNAYKLADGKLVGKWATLPGNGQVYAETLTFIKKL